MSRFTRWFEDRPTLHGLFVGLVLMGLVTVLLLVSGCSGATEDRGGTEKGSETPRTASLDHAGTLACTELATWFAGDEKPSTRVDMATAVNDLAADSRSGAIADKAELLIKPEVYDSNENWALAADMFAYECDVLGWKP